MTVVPRTAVFLCLIGRAYFQPEGEDVYRISQARVQNSKEVRLYIYVCMIESKLYPITMGDKDTQQDDINRCNAANLRAKRATRFLGRLNSSPTVR